MGYAYLVLALMLNALANILLKIGAERLLPGPILQLGNLNWQLVGGILLFAGNVILYALALRALPLSVAYPVMVAGGFVIVNAYAVFGLREAVSLLQILGYVAIVAGVLLVVVARSA